MKLSQAYHTIGGYTNRDGDLSLSLCPGRYGGDYQRSSNPLSPASYTGGNESDSSFQSSIGATSPITPGPMNNNNPNLLTAQFNNLNNLGPGTGGSASGTTAITNTATTSVPTPATTSSLTIPPKGTSVLSSIRERGENDTTTILSDRDIEEEDEIDEDDDEEGEEDEVVGGPLGMMPSGAAGGVVEVPDGQRRVDGEELKRGMEGERMVKSGYLLKKGEKRKVSCRKF